MPVVTSAVRAFLQDILDDERGLGLVHGPDSFRHPEFIEQFLESIPNTVAVANVDGARLSASQFLAEVFEQFGYEHELDSEDDLLRMLEVIVVHQTRSNRAPVLVIRNLGAMYPSCLALLCRLASLRAGQHYALRIVLVGDRPFHRIIDSPKMEAIASRLVGRLDLEQIDHWEFPQFIVSLDGEVVQQFEMQGSRTLIGRSGICEIHLQDLCVSRQHALLINDEDTLVLFDLRSKNGTSVNSIDVSTRVLNDSDVIAISDFRLKVALPESYNTKSENPDAADTARMKHIEDARRARERHSRQPGRDFEEKA